MKKPTILNKKKPAIKYPCPWTYRIIGESSECIFHAVNTMIPDKDSYSLKPANVSKKGNYVSYHLNIVVLSEQQKEHYKSFLLSQKGIRFIL